MWYKRNLRNPFEFNVKWGGAKVPLLLCLNGQGCPQTLKDKALACRSVLVFVEEKVFFGGVIRPNVLNRVKGLAVIFQLLQVFNHFQGHPCASRNR